jgi:hypothetical protein
MGTPSLFVGYAGELASSGFPARFLARPREWTYAILLIIT